MRVVVCVKHVPDTTELRVDPATGAPMLQYAPTRINDYDRHALEEAARLREQQGASVSVLCAGPPEAVRTMKEAVAAGADEAFLVSGPWAADLDPGASARVLAAGVRHLGECDLVLCGDLSEDGYYGLVPGMLAAHLGVPYVASATRLEVAGDAATVTIGAASGSYGGAPDSRDNVIELVAQDMQGLDVTLNGAHLPEHKNRADFDAATKGWLNAGGNVILAKSGKMNVADAKTFEFTLRPSFVLPSEKFRLGNWNPADAIKLTACMLLGRAH